MSEYVRTNRRIWNEGDFRELGSDAKLLWHYMFTCPHGNMLGLFILRPGYIEVDLNWSSDRFLKAYGELDGSHKPPQLAMGDLAPDPPERRPLINYDYKAGLLLVYDFLEHNPLQNPNQVKAACKKVDELPPSQLLVELADLLQARIDTGELEGTDHQPLIKALRDRSQRTRKPQGNGMPNRRGTVRDSETETETGTVAETESSDGGKNCGNVDKEEEGPQGRRRAAPGCAWGEHPDDAARGILRDLKMDEWDAKEFPASRRIVNTYDVTVIRAAIMATRDAQDGLEGGVRNTMAYFQNELKKATAGGAESGTTER